MTNPETKKPTIDVGGAGGGTRTPTTLRSPDFESESTIARQDTEDAPRRQTTHTGSIVRAPNGSERMEYGTNPPHGLEAGAGWWCLTCKAPGCFADSSCAHRHRWSYDAAKVAAYWAQPVDGGAQ